MRVSEQFGSPHVAAPALETPEFDTFVDVHVIFRTAAIEISGTFRGDNFPNGEVFATDVTGRAIMLFEFETTGGQDTGPFTRLFGSGDRWASLLVGVRGFEPPASASRIMSAYFSALEQCGSRHVFQCSTTVSTIVLMSW